MGKRKEIPLDEVPREERPWVSLEELIPYCGAILRGVKDPRRKLRDVMTQEKCVKLVGGAPVVLTGRLHDHFREVYTAWVQGEA